MTAVAPATHTAYVTSEDELRAVIGYPIQRVVDKVQPRLASLHRQWIAASPFLLMATSGADGTCDVSPKGDPAGFVHVLDDRTVVMPERPGNRRADGFHNLLGNPHVGLIFVIPGRGDTLRVNGRATLVRDASFMDAMVVRGHRPTLALVVDIDEVFYHCSKAFLRSRAWEPEEWEPAAAPRRAVIAKALERQGEDLASLDEYYGPKYAEKIYG